MIWFVLGFVLGAITRRAWVRGGAAWAWSVLRGFLLWIKDGASGYASPSTPARFFARETVSRETPRETVRPVRPKIPMKVALRNWGEFLAGCAGFALRHPVFVAGVIVLVLVLMVARDLRLPFDFAKSREALRAERDAARLDADVAARETEIASQAIHLAEATERDHARVERVLTEAQGQIADAVDDADFDRLFIAYERAYVSVWNNVGPADNGNPPAGAIDGLRGFSANPA